MLFALMQKFIRQQWRMWIETPGPRHTLSALTTEFIRQQWRMWIETNAFFGNL